MSIVRYLLKSINLKLHLNLLSELCFPDIFSGRLLRRTFHSDNLPGWQLSVKADGLLVVCSRNKYNEKQCIGHE